MFKNKFLISLMLLSLFLNGGAQTDSVKKPLLKISSFGINFGLGFIETQNISHQQFIDLAPNNSLINPDLSKAEEISWNRTTFRELGTSISFKTFNKEKNRYVRIIYQFNISYQIPAGREIMYEIKDTLPVYTYTGSSTCVNSNSSCFHFSNYNYSYHYKVLFLDLTGKFNIVNTPRFKFYTGFSLGFGYYFNRKVEAIFLDSEGSSRYNYFSLANPPITDITKQETTKLKSQESYQLSVPFGLLLKFHRRSPLTINPELRFGERIEHGQKSGYTNRFFFSTSIGLRFLFK